MGWLGRKYLADPAPAAVFARSSRSALAACPMANCAWLALHPSEADGGDGDGVVVLSLRRLHASIAQLATTTHVTRNREIRM
jgi:hypothetical protein